jgi:hypothetical protein
MPAGTAAAPGPRARFTARPQPGPGRRCERSHSHPSVHMLRLISAVSLRMLGTGCMLSMANQSGSRRTGVAEATNGECIKPLTDHASPTPNHPGPVPTHDVCALCADVLWSQSTTEDSCTASSDRDEAAAAEREGGPASLRHLRTGRGLGRSQDHARAVEKLTCEWFTHECAQGARGKLAQNKASLWTYVMRACTGTLFVSLAAARRRRHQPLGHLRPSNPPSTASSNTRQPIRLQSTAVDLGVLTWFHVHILGQSVTAIRVSIWFAGAERASALSRSA